MNFLTHSLKARLMVIVMSGLFLLLFAAFLAITQLNGSLDDYRSLINKQIVAERKINQINIDFKTQVQEWKNTLLRGDDTSNREKYWGRFQKKQALIQEEVRDILQDLPTGESRSLVTSFQNSHKIMGEKYQQGFDAFVASGYDHTVGDKAVKGIDREPSKVLKQAVETISEDVHALSIQYDASSAEVTTYSSISVFTAAAIIVAVLWMVITRSVLWPLKDVMEIINHLKKGNFQSDIHTNREDELGDLSRGLGAMQEEIVKIITRVQEATDELNSASDSITQTASDIVRNTGESQGCTDQVAAAINEMSSTVQEVAHNASGAAEAAQTADTNAKDGLQVMNKTIDSISSLSTEVDHIVGAMDTLEQETSRVGAVLDVIKGVAEQTNLLALNAAIEAARAGEQGRGFAVVADEVRALAQRTQESTAEIQQIIEAVQNGASTAVNAMRDGQTKTQETVELASQAGETIRSITDSVGSIRDMNTAIATAAEEQSVAAEEINRNVNNVVALVQEAHSSAEYSTTIANALNSTSSELTDLVKRFVV